MLRLVRISSSQPSSFSRVDIWALMVGWDTPRVLAALEKLPCFTTMQNASICLKSILTSLLIKYYLYVL